MSAEIPENADSRSTSFRQIIDAILSLATAAVMDAAIGPYQGKETCRRQLRSADTA